MQSFEGSASLTRNLTTLVTEHETTNRGDKTEKDGQEWDLLRLSWQLRHAFGVRLLESGGIRGLCLLLLAEETHGGCESELDNDGE